MSAVVSSGLRLSFKSHNFNGKWHIQFLLFLLDLFHNFEFGKLENRHRRTKSNSHVQVHCPLASKMSNTEYTPIDITVHVMLMMVNVNADRKTELGLHGAGCGYVWLIAWINVFPSRGKSFWNSISVYSSFSVTLRYGTCQSEAHRHTHSDSSKAKKYIYKSEHQHRHWPYVRTAVAAHRTHAHTLSHQIYYNIFAVDKSCIHARERKKCYEIFPTQERHSPHIHLSIQTQRAYMVQRWFQAPLCSAISMPKTARRKPNAANAHTRFHFQYARESLLLRFPLNTLGTHSLVRRSALAAWTESNRTQSITNSHVLRTTQSRTPSNSATLAVAVARQSIQLYRDILEMRSLLQCCRAWIDAHIENRFAVRRSEYKTNSNSPRRIELPVVNRTSGSRTNQYFPIFDFHLNAVPSIPKRMWTAKINELIVGRWTAEDPEKTLRTI